MERVQAVVPQEFIASDCGYVKLEKLVVVCGQPNGVCLVAVRSKCVMHARGYVHHDSVTKGRHWRVIPVKGSVELYVFDDVGAVPRGMQHV